MIHLLNCSNSSRTFYRRSPEIVLHQYLEFTNGGHYVRFSIASRVLTPYQTPTETYYRGRGGGGLLSVYSSYQNLFFVPVLGDCRGPSGALQSRARMDSGSRTMYSLHLGTCSFIRVRCSPRRTPQGARLGFRLSLRLFTKIFPQKSFYQSPFLHENPYQNLSTKIFLPKSFFTRKSISSWV